MPVLTRIEAKPNSVQGIDCVQAQNPHNQVGRCGGHPDFTVGGLHRLPLDHETQLQMELVGKMFLIELTII